MDKHTATELAYKNGYAKGYADGVKEFAERLQQVFYSDDAGDVCLRKIINHIAKEMVGADNE